MKTAMQVVPDAIAEALAAQRATTARATDAAKALSRIDVALTKAREHVAEHTAAQARLQSLRNERRALVADELMGSGDVAAIEANAAASTEAEARVHELAPLARDAEGALEALEGRLHEAAATAREAQNATHAAHYRLLVSAADPLLAIYREAIEVAMDRYTEVIALVEGINRHGRLANSPFVGPETPQPMTFPGVSIGHWKTVNTAAAGPSQMQAARERLAERLRELGIE